MKKTITQFIDLPIEEGKTYKTKFQTGDVFTVQRLSKHVAHGIFVGREHLGVCPLNLDRIQPEQIEHVTIDVCSNCGSVV